MTKEQIYGFGSSVILCLLILLLLSFVVLRTEIRAETEGILVDIGNVEWASGTSEPAPSGFNTGTSDIVPIPEIISTPEIPAPQPASPAPAPVVITQSAEQTAAIEAERQRKEQERRAEQEQRVAEQKRQQEEQQRKDAIDRQMAEAFGAGNTPNGSQGTTTSGSGNQGSPYGNASGGAQTGVGGIGSFDLSGRSLRGGSLPRPAYDVQEEGTIVVEITVDPQGNVIQAEVRRLGTNIVNANMRRSAVEAAKKSTFNTINGVQNQIGTITYRYTLK